MVLIVTGLTKSPDPPFKTLSRNPYRQVRGPDYRNPYRTLRDTLWIAAWTLSPEMWLSRLVAGPFKFGFRLRVLNKANLQLVQVPRPPPTTLEYNYPKYPLLLGGAGDLVSRL